ncbi:hypothetical protein VP01_1748g9 [Puccinia sorghi]|uniref:Uncharacterized protein n=1 Tax=Puccinia sorghi TaxID=27349 RepID=A0A0L6VF24_9BASI|nr:hypothetical protein VP01_1748g9 [Puccinia sorghi]
MSPKKKPQKRKRPFSSSSQDESKVNVDRLLEATPKSVTSTSVKQVLDSKGPDESSATNNTPSGQALETLSSLFLDEVDEDEHMGFVCVLEDSKKEATFLSLVKTSKKNMLHVACQRINLIYLLLIQFFLKLYLNSKREGS